MDKTINFQLNKPSYNDPVDIEALNENLDIVDSNLGVVVGGGINWLGTFPTYPEDPQKNDAFYHTGTKKSYIYNGTSWDVMAESAEGGEGINWLGVLSAYPDTPKKNDAFYHTGTKKSYIYNGISWDVMAESVEGGEGINWLGPLSDYPSTPDKNDAFYHSVDKKSYIYNGDSWDVMAESGPPGADGAPGTPGSYYAPYWVGASAINGGSVVSPLIISNFLRIAGELLVGSTNGVVGISGADAADNNAIRIWAGNATKGNAPFRVTQGGKVVATDVEMSGIFDVYAGLTLLARLFKDNNGGKLIINDNDGLLNVTIGSESGAGGNVGGTICLYNDSENKKRVALGIYSDGDYGQLQALNKDGVKTAVLSAALNENYQYGTLGLFSAAGVLQTLIRAAADSYFLNSVAIGKTTVTSGYKLDVDGKVKCTTLSTLNYGTGNPSGGSNGDLYFQYS